jgi:hypothetical protein
MYLHKKSSKRKNKATFKGQRDNVNKAKPPPAVLSTVGEEIWGGGGGVKSTGGGDSTVIAWSKSLKIRFLSQLRPRIHPLDAF